MSGEKKTDLLIPKNSAAISSLEPTQQALQLFANSLNEITDVTQFKERFDLYVDMAHRLNQLREEFSKTEMNIREREESIRREIEEKKIELKAKKIEDRFKIANKLIVTIAGLTLSISGWFVYKVDAYLGGFFITSGLGALGITVKSAFFPKKIK